MAAQLPSPPSSRPTSPEPSPESHNDIESLASRLDALLIEYLSLLDTYTLLREQLSKHFASGFFALAQANRNANSTLGAGRRYGEEGYDERMKAGRILSIARSRRSYTGEGVQKAELEIEGEEKKQEEGPQDQSSHIAEADGTGSVHAEADKQEDSAMYTYSLGPSPTSTKDPLKWYGILIPPALRTCQTHFTSAVSSSIPELLNTTSKMRRVEEDIWNLRRELGVMDEYTVSEQATTKSADGSDGDRELDIPMASFSLSPTTSKVQAARKSTGRLSTSPTSVGLPLEPRSRILKLG
ncbi:hypothetical protein H2200_008000 [Cladophialophora chaetospira]|uniref:Vacuolar ATPase assembly protein VMA22 n=1 Tax=Cladophialophora chaetospira TaxID=386627 RepID=A0AA38X796_9EURO|nr:hypothetical protein H2200_008000 [Cladophialophora chaetospira]